MYIHSLPTPTPQHTQLVLFLWRTMPDTHLSIFIHMHIDTYINAEIKCLKNIGISQYLQENVFKSNCISLCIEYFWDLLYHRTIWLQNIVWNLYYMKTILRNLRLATGDKKGKFEAVIVGKWIKWEKCFLEDTDIQAFYGAQYCAIRVFITFSVNEVDSGIYPPLVISKKVHRKATECVILKMIFMKLLHCGNISYVPKLLT